MTPDSKAEHDQAADLSQSNVSATLLMAYYEAIEHASADMLEAARSGNWDQVVEDRRRLRAADQPAASARRA